MAFTLCYLYFPHLLILQLQLQMHGGTQMFHKRGLILKIIFLLILTSDTLTFGMAKTNSEIFYLFQLKLAQSLYVLGIVLSTFLTSTDSLSPHQLLFILYICENGSTQLVKSRTRNQIRQSGSGIHAHIQIALLQLSHQLQQSR